MPRKKSDFAQALDDPSFRAQITQPKPRRSSSRPKPDAVPPSSVDPKRLQEALGAALAKLDEVRNDPKRFTVYVDDPLGFSNDILGIPVWKPENPDVAGLTPDQVELLLTVAGGHRRVAVKAGHSVGKSFVLAILVLWWLYCRRGMVVTTAATWEQTERVLWREIATRHAAARVPLPGQLMQVELRLAPDWYAVGLNTKEAGAFRGRHHARLLVIMDEAPAIADTIHDEASSLATGENNVIVMVGNPLDSHGAFHRAFVKGPWKRLHFSCLNHPNVLLGREIIPGAVTRSWVKEQADRYGEDSPLYASRVLGEFPAGGSFAVIPAGLVDKAMEETQYRAALAALEKRQTAGQWVEPVVLACDVARYGVNRTVLIHRRGRVVTKIDHWSGLDTMMTVGLIVQAWRETEAQWVIVDEVGLGGPVVDRLLELEVPVVGFHSGRVASDKALYGNRRAEGWFRLRQLLEGGGLLLPEHEDLRADLVEPRYQVNSAGKIMVEKKEDLRRRGVQSPDFADALVMSLAVPDDDPPPVAGEELFHVDTNPFVPRRADYHDVLAGF